MGHSAKRVANHCPTTKRNKWRSSKQNHILSAQKSFLEKVVFAIQFQKAADCRGELRSLNNERNFPMLNEIGLPLYNPAVPKRNRVRSAQRFFGKSC